MAEKKSVRERIGDENYAKLKQYDSVYKKNNYVQFPIRLSKIYEQDVIEKINSVGNKRQYIIKLIRKDIESGED